MDDLAMSPRRLNEGARNYTEELNPDSDSKCTQLWQNFEEMMENAKQKTNELCEEIRQITDEQVKRWHHLLEENEKILKRLEIWRINLHHLLNESQQDVDIVCGLRLLGSKLSSRLHKSFEPEWKYLLGVTFSNWWLQVMEQLKIEKIGTVSLTKLPGENLVFSKQWKLKESNLDIRSIHISKEDDHVFLCDVINKSMIEYTGGGELLRACQFIDGTKRSTSLDTCSISVGILAVACGYEKKIIFLIKKENSSIFTDKSNH